MSAHLSLGGCSIRSRLLLGLLLLLELGLLVGLGRGLLVGLQFGSGLGIRFGLMMMMMMVVGEGEPPNKRMQAGAKQELDGETDTFQNFCLDAWSTVQNIDVAGTRPE